MWPHAFQTLTLAPQPRALGTVEASSCHFYGGAAAKHPPPPPQHTPPCMSTYYVPGLRRCHLLFLTQSWGPLGDPHFTDKDTEAQREKGSSKVTGLPSKQRSLKSRFGGAANGPFFLFGHLHSIPLEDSPQPLSPHQDSFYVWSLFSQFC